MRIAKPKLGYGVMVSTTDFDSVSLGSSPSSPTKLTNMEEIEKIDIRLRKIFRKVFRNMSPETIFHAHHAYSMMEVYARRDY